MKKAILPLMAALAFSACSDRVPPVAETAYLPSVNDRVIGAATAASGNTAKPVQVHYNAQTGKYYQLPAGSLALANSGVIKPKIQRSKTLPAAQGNGEHGIWLSHNAGKGRVIFSNGIDDRLAIARAASTCKSLQQQASVSAIAILPDNRKQMSFVCS